MRLSQGTVMSRSVAMMPRIFELPGKTFLLSAACLLPAAEHCAQDVPNSRIFCSEPGDAGSPCDSSCSCSEDVFAIAFEPTREATMNLEDFEPGLRVDSLVILDAKTVGIQGWSLGVAHDARYLTIESVTFEGTDAAGFFRGGFQVTGIARALPCNIEPCPEPSSPGGFISATVLSFVDNNAVLPAGRHSVARATHALLPRAAEVGEADIRLEFQSGLSAGGQPVEIVLTVNGTTRRPRVVVDGRIYLVPGGRLFHRGDPNGDGRVSIGDAVGIIMFLFLLGPSPICLEAGDADDNGRLDTTDPIIILRWLFHGESAPASPGPPPLPCGVDPDAPAGSLGCDAYEAC